MRLIIAGERIDYDGSQINALWAYAKFRAREDSIVCFRGGCDVTIEHMIDLEDRVNNERIYSPDMLQFIVEHFDDPDIRLAYARQRLLACIAAESLKHRGYIVTRKGDDLFYDGKKLSVGIAAAGPTSHKIHFGMNVRCDEYMSLEKMGVKDVDVLMEEIGGNYAGEIEDIEGDIRKSRPLEAHVP